MFLCRYDVGDACNINHVCVKCESIVSLYVHECSETYSISAGSLLIIVVGVCAQCHKRLSVAVGYWGSLTALWEVWDSVKAQVQHSASNTFACGMK